MKSRSMPLSTTGMKPWPTRRYAAWSAASTTLRRSETAFARSYAAPMRSLYCPSRIHIRSGRYWDNELSLFPPTAPIRTFARQHRDGKVRPFGKQALLVIRRNTNVKLVEPPSCSSASPIIFMGSNSRGNWVAQEQNGRYGGLFVNRAQAFKYALFEN